MSAPANVEEQLRDLGVRVAALETAATEQAARLLRFVLRFELVITDITRRFDAIDQQFQGLQTMLVAHGKRLADQGQVLAEILTRLDNHDRGLQQVLARLPQPPGGAS